MRRFSFLISMLLIVVGSVFAQGTTSQATATCNFDPTKQLAVEYQRMSINSKKPVFGHEIPYDKIWAPGGKPMTLFVNSPVSIGNEQLPVGAYTMFVLPDENRWKLVISKSTDTTGKYDKKDDLVRVPMDYGQLGSPEDQFSVYFAHVAPNQCSMRLDLATSRAWVVFQEK